MTISFRPFKTAAALLLAAAMPHGAAHGEETLPIFDVHAHYSEPAWTAHAVEAIFRKFEDAGVPRALVSSSPDEGTLKLYRHDPARIGPVLRPYRGAVGIANWTEDAATPDYLRERLARGIYKGIGEFHLSTEADAATPVLREVVALALEYDVVLHVHSPAPPVETLFAAAPELRILWAHAGLSEPPDVVEDLLGRYRNLWVELAIRAWDIAPGGTLSDRWRALFLKHPNRFMIGSDTWVTSRWDDYTSIIAQHRQWLMQLPEPPRRAVAHDNAMRLFAVGGSN